MVYMLYNMLYILYIKYMCVYIYFVPKDKMMYDKYLYS